jgi:PAS domain S-box-containing protein
MPDWKKQRVHYVADDEGHLVPEAAGTSQALAVTPLEQFDLIVVENGSPVEATLRAGEILESIGDAFYFLDEELRFTYVNRKAEQLWGKRREDLLGRKFMDVFPHVEGSHSKLKIMQALEEDRPLTYETFSPNIGRWVEVSAYPSSGGLSVHYRDITERKRLELRPRRARRRHAVIATHLSSRTGARPCGCWHSYMQAESLGGSSGGRNQRSQARASASKRQLPGRGAAPPRPTGPSGGSRGGSRPSCWR